MFGTSGEMLPILSSMNKIQSCCLLRLTMGVIALFADHQSGLQLLLLPFAFYLLKDDPKPLFFSKVELYLLNINKNKNKK